METTTQSMGIKRWLEKGTTTPSTATVTQQGFGEKFKTLNLLFLCKNYETKIH